MNAERYLIVSLGSIGRRHLRNLRSLRPDAEIGVWRQRARLAENELPTGANTQFDTLEAARSFQPRAAIVAGPASTHLPVALALARAGIPLLVEKPLADQTAGLDELVALCQAQGLALMTAYNLRFLPSLQETRRLLADGTIGQVLGARAEVGQYLPDWRPDSDYRQTVSAQRSLGGGPLLELSHELDYLYWLFGLPARVTARGGRYSQLDIDVEDMVEICLEYSSPKRLVNVHLDMLQRAVTRRCRFIGTEGTLIWDGITDRIECYRASSQRWETYDQFAIGDRNRMYLDELAHFLDCVQDGTPPLIDGAQGLAVLGLVEAARESLKRDSTVDLEPQ
jgi:predicted dehydrogenase